MLRNTSITQNVAIVDMLKYTTEGEEKRGWDEMTENKKSLVCIRDEKNGQFHDLPIVQRQLRDDIALFTKAAHANYATEESNDVLTLVEWKEELRGVNEILKIPFDVLVVVEKGAVRKNDRK